MKTIFLTSFQPFISRNILNAGVLDELIKNNKVIVFVPKYKEEFFKENFKEVEIVGFELKSYINTKEKIFKNIADLLLDTNTKKFHKMIDKYYSKNNIRYLLTNYFTKIFTNIPGSTKIFRFLDLKINNPKSFREYFDQYKPDVVFATDVFDDSDVLMMKNSKSSGVKCVGMVRSWDNTTSKTLMRVVPDTLIVQNEIIKEESERLHSVPENIIKLSGIAHYDKYIDYKPSRSISEFCNDMGLNPNKKTVLVSPAGEKFFSTDWQILEILKKAINDKKINQAVQFLVRVHPTNKVEFHDFIPDNNFIIEEPGITVGGGRSKDNELDREGITHLKDTLYHSDVVINTLSSIVIDAAVFDKPIITIGFDGMEKRIPFERSVDLYLKEENMAKLLEIGAAPVVEDEDELIEQINQYLNNPELHKKERSDLIIQQCWKLDNQSKERIVNIILEK